MNQPLGPVVEPVRAKGAEQPRAALQLFAGAGARRFHVTTAPFLDNEYLDRFFGGEGPARNF